MIISNKQIMQLMAIASDYNKTIELMIEKRIAEGAPKLVSKDIQNLLLNIRSQQSEELKVIE